MSTTMVDIFTFTFYLGLTTAIFVPYAKTLPDPDSIMIGVESLINSTQLINSVGSLSLPNLGSLIMM